MFVILVSHEIENSIPVLPHIGMMIISVATVSISLSLNIYLTTFLFLLIFS